MTIFLIYRGLRGSRRYCCRGGCLSRGRFLHVRHYTARIANHLVAGIGDPGIRIFRPISVYSCELVVSLAQFFQKRISLRGQALFKFLRAITVATRPWLAAVFVAAGAARVRIFHAEQFEIFLPIRAFLRQRRIAKTSLNPGRDAPIVYPRLLHIVQVFVTCDGATAQRAIINCANQTAFPSRFHTSFHEVTHEQKDSINPECTRISWMGKHTRPRPPQDGFAVANVLVSASRRNDLLLLTMNPATNEQEVRNLFN